MDSSPHHLPPRVRNKLSEAEQRVLAPPCYEIAWERIFTTDEKQAIDAATSKAQAQEKGEIEGEPDSRWLSPNLIQSYMNVRKVSQYRATIELAHALNFLTELDRNWLLCKTGESEDEAVADTSRNEKTRPRWDEKNLSLYFDGDVVRRVQRPKRAVNIVRILKVFEEEGWPGRIDDPLPDGPDPVRLAAAIRSLNAGLSRIRFHKDGSGEGVTWRKR